jgi:hypothetical protein
MGIFDDLAEKPKKRGRPPKPHKWPKADIVSVANSIVKVPSPQSYERIGGKRKLLTKDLAQAILDRVRRGVFEHIAAQAVGVDTKELQGFKDTYPTFVRDLATAHAQARADREEYVAETEPERWLEKGPGKERQGEDPGWGTAKVEQQQALPPPPPDRYKFLWRLSEAEFKELERLQRKAMQAGEVIDVTPVPLLEGSKEHTDDGSGKADRAGQPGEGPRADSGRDQEDREHGSGGTSRPV